MHMQTRLAGEHHYGLCHLVWLGALLLPNAGCIDGIEIWNALHDHGRGHDHGSADASTPSEDAGASIEDASAPLADASTPPPDASTPPADASTPSADASTPPPDAGCQPNCEGRECGPDGCGGACAPGCSGAEACQADGNCTATTLFADVWPLLDNFGCPSCHVGSAPPAGLNLSDEDTAYSNLVGATSSECGAGRLRVAPGDPSASYVINKLEGVDLCAGQRMPLGGPFMSQAQIDMVRAWITAGAPR